MNHKHSLNTARLSCCIFLVMFTLTLSTQVLQTFPLLKHLISPSQNYTHLMKHFSSLKNCSPQTRPYTPTLTPTHLPPLTPTFSALSLVINDMFRAKPVLPVVYYAPLSPLSPTQKNFSSLSLSLLHYKISLFTHQHTNIALFTT